MNCKEIKTLLSVCLDNELKKDEENLVIEHLKTCKNCSLELDKFKQIQKLFSYKEKVEPAPFFETRLFNRIHKKEHAIGLSRVVKRIIYAGGGLLFISTVLILSMFLIPKNHIYEEIQKYVFQETLDSVNKRIPLESEITNEDVISFVIYNG